MDSEKQCPVCRAGEAEALFQWNDVPANIAILWPTRESAINCAKGTLDIRCCRGCGYVWNADFDPDLLEYSEAYDNSLHHSTVYADYARDLATDLVERHGLRDRHVMEIGCGKGDFLMLLCSIGGNSGTGFDASFEDRDLGPELEGRVNVVREFYGERHAGESGDLIACRNVLEHIGDPVSFLRLVRRNIGDASRPVVFFEVPDVYLILEQLSVWDFIYEHVSYFSPASLTRAFEAAGFDVLGVRETYRGQFLTLEAVPSEQGAGRQVDVSDDLDRMRRALDGFRTATEERQTRWSALLDEIRAKDEKVLVWGAGAKAVSFLNMLDAGDALPFVVDQNPGKHGKFIAGTGQRIVEPDFAREFKPDKVVVMNPVYSGEIGAKLEEMDVSTELLPV